MSQELTQSSKVVKDCTATPNSNSISTDTLAMIEGKRRDALNKLNVRRAQGMSANTSTILC